MKKYKVILLLSIMILSLGACETVDFGDTNENTNGPSEFDSAALLAGAQRRFITTGFRDWLMNPNLYVQYQAQPVYEDESRYAENPTSWDAFYVQTLANIDQILTISADEEMVQDPAYVSNGAMENQVGVARIMRVLIYKKVTDTYGDIPYFDALNPEIQSPSYTPQEEIYADFITELQEARDMMDPALAGPSGDIINNGDVAKWQKFANSLLLTIGLQISDANETLGRDTFVEALGDENGVIETLGDEAWYQPVNVSTLINPWTAFRPADYNMSDYVQDALQGDEEDYSNSTFDSRLSIYSDNPEGEGLTYGVPAGDASSSTRMSLYLTSPETPFPLLTSAYTYLNRAEAAEKEWTDEDAEDMLEMGIIQSYASVSNYFGMGPHVESAGLDPMDITDEAEDFAAARLADAASVGMDQVIGEEKWAALFGQGFDSWTEWRRTDFPILTPSPAPLNDGDIPTRYLYPSTEINLNNSNYQTGVGSLTPADDKNTSRVWWDVD